MNIISTEKEYKKYITLKKLARILRKNQTPFEEKLWRNIRNKQILNITFYRQKILFNKFIVDFYAPKIKLVIELDGSQHYSISHIKKDNFRDQFLLKNGIIVKRYSNLIITKEINSALNDIYNIANARLKLFKLNI